MGIAVQARRETGQSPRIGLSRSLMRRSTALSLVAVLSVVFAGCARGPASANDDQPDDPAAPATVAADGELTMTKLRESVGCDGTAQDVGDITGAQPNELLVFSAAVPIDVTSAVADDAGRYRMTWNCDPNEARLQWELTASGHDSGRKVIFTIVGASADAVSEPNGGITAQGLTVDVSSEPFACDGFTRKIGTISGAAPNEQINFTSPESVNLRPGDANELGSIDLNWECEPADAGKIWNVTATGTQSGNVGFFTVLGAGVDTAAAPALAVTVFEEPFVCDGLSREFATIENFAPEEVVDFNSEEADGLIDGRADGAGRLNVRWQCGLGDVGKTWRLDALGVSSQRMTTLTITAAAPAADGGTDLAVTFSENPFGCDGTSREFAIITNFTVGELVNFSSPQSGALRSGQADEFGDLAVRWQCGAGDIDKIWDVTAVGGSSGRSISFQIIGASPTP